jgi:Caspase domain/Sel1 repeat
METTMVRSVVLSLIFFALSGCRQNEGTSGKQLAMEVPGLASVNPDAYLEVDCLLPGQVRKLGSAVFVGSRRPLKTTANDCEIRGGEYVLFDRANYRDALAVWMVEAEGGDPVASTYVGEIYMKSPPEQPRYDLAAKWFLAAADKGHKRAQINLGYLYENGLGVATDTAQAAIWYGRASGVNPAEIVQQQQQSDSERQELARLKEENAAQAARLTTLQAALQSASAAAQTTGKELEQRNKAVTKQQRELAAREQELRQIKTTLAAGQKERAEALQEKVIELDRLVQSNGRELSEEKRRAAELAAQVEQKRRQEQEARAQLLAMNEKLQAMPGPHIEVFDPQLLRTRGVVVAPVAKNAVHRVITGQVWTPVGLQYLRINGREITPEADGNFKAQLSLGKEEESVHVIAADRNGKTNEMRFTLQRRDSGQGEATAGPTSPAQKVDGIAFGNYYALVIGNNNYRHLPKLQTAVSDARTVGKVLEERYGFSVTLLEDANRTAILSALNDFRKKLTEKDNFLIYYAGHGTLEEKNAQGFWLPVDATQDDDVNWLPTDRITGVMNLMSAKQIMVVADACYSGFMTRATLTRLEAGKSNESYAKWLEKMATYKSRVVISSGENKPVLDGGGGSHSVFARAFLDALRSNTGILPGIDLHRAIAEKVVDASGRLGLDQVPQYAGLNRAGHELGDFLFVPKEAKRS